MMVESASKAAANLSVSLVCIGFVFYFSVVEKLIPISILKVVNGVQNSPATGVSFWQSQQRETEQCRRMVFLGHGLLEQAHKEGGVAEKMLVETNEEFEFS